MAKTRSSQGRNSSSPSSSATSAVQKNNKRSAESSSSPAAKRGKKTLNKSTPQKEKSVKKTTPPKEKEQKTIEESFNAESMEGIECDRDVEMQIKGDDKGEQARETGDQKVEAEKQAVSDDQEKHAEQKEDGQKPQHSQTESSEKETSKLDSDDSKGEEMTGVPADEKNAFDQVKADESEVKELGKQEQEEKTASINESNESVVESEERESAIPSSILEKGIIYFFFRGRVGVEHPQGIEDVARSYIILRPLPLGAKLGEGPLEDPGNARMLALPKKMLPKSKTDRFLVFVEKGKASIKDLRDQFTENDYSTKTSGTSHIPAATPFADGIYAITTTGRESHLAYHITAPSPIGDIQKELGLNEKGSYVVSVKNPNASGPANATIDNPAKYPESIQNKFRNRRWMPLEPEVLEYEGTQFLIVGEGLGDVEKATEELSKDQRDENKETPSEELEKLEAEDHERVEHLKEDDPIFADLGLSSAEYKKMGTTW